MPGLRPVGCRPKKHESRRHLSVPATCRSYSTRICRRHGSAKPFFPPQLRNSGGATTVRQTKRKGWECGLKGNSCSSLVGLSGDAERTQCAVATLIAVRIVPRNGCLARFVTYGLVKVRD